MLVLESSFISLYFEHWVHVDFFYISELGYFQVNKVSEILFYHLQNLILYINHSLNEAKQAEMNISIRVFCQLINLTVKLKFLGDQHPEWVAFDEEKHSYDGFVLNDNIRVFD